MPSEGVSILMAKPMVFSYFGEKLAIKKDTDRKTLIAL